MVMVGHSLGGFLALWVAATAPDAVGPIVAVDGVPYKTAGEAVYEMMVTDIRDRMSRSAMDTFFATR